MRRMMKLGFLPIALLLVSLAAAGVVLADDYEPNDPYTQDHESCTPHTKFRYSQRSDVLDWGIMVLCATTVNEILMTGNLFYYDAVDQRWLHVDYEVGHCRDYICQREGSVNRPPRGDWDIVICFSASSPTSIWPHQCQRVTYSLP